MAFWKAHWTVFGRVEMMDSLLVAGRAIEKVVCWAERWAEKMGALKVVQMDIETAYASA